MLPIKNSESHGRVHFAAPVPVPANLLMEARRHRDAIARLVGGPADLRTLPAEGLRIVLFAAVRVVEVGASVRLGLLDPANRKDRRRACLGSSMDVAKH